MHGALAPSPQQRAGDARRLYLFVGIAVAVLLVTGVAVLVTTEPTSSAPPPRNEASYQLGYEDGKKLMGEGVTPDDASCKGRYEAEAIFADDPILHPGPVAVYHDFMVGCEDARSGG